MACFKIASIASSGGNLLLNLPVDTLTFRNGERSCIVLCSDIPASTTVLPVYLAVGTNTVPVYDMLGNQLYSDQLATRTAIPGVWGTNPNHFKLCACVNGRSQATAPSVTIPPVTEG